MNTAAKSNTWGEGKLGRSWKGRHYYPSCTYLSYQKLNEFGRREGGIKKWWAYENSGVTWELVGGSYWCAAPQRVSKTPWGISDVHKLHVVWTQNFRKWGTHPETMHVPAARTALPLTCEAFLLQKNTLHPRLCFTNTLLLIPLPLRCSVCVLSFQHLLRFLRLYTRKHPDLLHTGTRKNTHRNVAISPACISVWFRWERGEEDAWGKVAELGSVRGQGLI